MYKLIFISLILISLSCSLIDKKKPNDYKITKETLNNNLQKNTEEGQLNADIKLINDSVNIDKDCVESFLDTDDVYSFTVLGLACKRGDLQSVIAQINSGACIESCMADGIYNYDLLYTSLIFNQYEVLDYIIENRLYSDVNKVYDENNTTPLVLSCKIENDKIALQYVNLFIKKGANINVNYNYGGENTHYPIIVAIDNNKVKIVELLLLKGVDISIKNSEGYMVRELVDQYGSNEMKALFNAIE